MISEKIQGLILSRIDFPNESALAAVENLATAAAALGRSGDDFDDANAGTEPLADADVVGAGIIEFADLFAEVGGDKRAAAKAAFGKIFAAPSPAQKAAGERLFADALDFNIVAHALNGVLERLLAAPDEV